MTEHQEEKTQTSSELSTPMQRADELLRKMTVEEKVMQLSCVYPMGLLGTEGPIQSQLDAQLGQGIGHIAGLGTFGHKSPQKIAKTINAIQRYLVTQTRLKIPAIFHNEALNGVISPYFMHFPTPIGLAATWDPQAVEEMARIMRHQMRSVGMLQSLSPVMDLARDARWGRVHETYGEDPYLVSAMSTAFTRGMQGDDLREGVLATAKHFLGYAVTEAGQNMAATAISARELHDVYARPFESAIRLCGLGSVMASYAEFNGIPIHISHDILTKLLRGQLGFAGTVVSDYIGVGWAQTRQQAAASAEEVGSLALSAGMDVELPTVHGYGQVLAKAVRNGKVPESLLDESVRRVLRDKFALGLFDNPYVSEDEAKIVSIAKEGAELSLRLAQESVTLLKNENGLLPLSRDIARIAVIGPHADNTLVGFPAYTYPAALQMLRSMFTGGETSMAGTDSSNTWLPTEAKAAMKTEFQDIIDIEIEEYIKSNYQALSLSKAIKKLLPKTKITSVVGAGVTSSEPTDIQAAVKAAEDADVVILYVGGQSAWSGKNRTEGEGQDSANIDLPSQQVELIKAVIAVGKPTVAVVAMGRPQGLSSVIDYLPAVLTAYYGGPFQGIAIADALFGVINPGGKLPYTLPRHVGQVPIYHSQRVGSGYRRTTYDVHKGYVDMPSTPLFVFGHGLSYTTFEYSPLEVENSEIDTRGEIKFSVTITNTGNQIGSEVVQIYISDTATGVTLPAQQLVGFCRITLEPSSSKKIKFRIPIALLGYTGLSGNFVIEPGPVEVSAGSSSDDIRSRAKFTITGESRTITETDRVFFSVTEMD
ncbi:Glycoside hydrolase family 3 protein [Candidatus Nitrosocosmicus franklandus]|uniref:Glycoside hydrolase family 3 protein n=2 Tax=Candidatus Nitrosocosmicus franklandianus TaxID=1798806 RepID=A0A484I9M0_9ARCH|nr:Glycoside hydrolase family 3 protein [Candidatus Nitrosocosmicus franklandus]